MKWKYEPKHSNLTKKQSMSIGSRLIKFIRNSCFLLYFLVVHAQWPICSYQFSLWTRKWGKKNNKNRQYSLAFELFIFQFGTCVFSLSLYRFVDNQKHNNNELNKKKTTSVLKMEWNNGICRTKYRTIKLFILCK